MKRFAISLIIKTEYLPYFIVQFEIKWRHASWLSIAFSDTDLMLQFCLPKVQLGATNNTYELAMDNWIFQLNLNLISRYADNVKIVHPFDICLGSCLFDTSRE